MAGTSEHWIWKFDEWVIDTEKEYLYKPIGRGLGNVLKDIGTTFFEWFVIILPDLVGYGALATGAAVILSTMAGRGMAKPLSIFSGAFIISLCILGTD